jgi:hypothetical protein
MMSTVQPAQAVPSSGLRRLITGGERPPLPPSRTSMPAPLLEKMELPRTVCPLVAPPSTSTPIALAEITFPSPLAVPPKALF